MVYTDFEIEKNTMLTEEWEGGEYLLWPLNIYQFIAQMPVKFPTYIESIHLSLELNERTEKSLFYWDVGDFFMLSSNALHCVRGRGYTIYGNIIYCVFVNHHVYGKRRKIK